MRKKIRLLDSCEVSVPSLQNHSKCTEIQGSYKGVYEYSNKVVSIKEAKLQQPMAHQASRGITKANAEQPLQRRKLRSLPHSSSTPKDINLHCYPSKRNPFATIDWELMLRQQMSR